MKDRFDVAEDIIFLIDTPEVRAMLSGGIYADDRPGGSSDIDIVVKSTGITNQQFQVGTANVNIYVPDLSSGRKDTMVFRKIFRVLKPLLDAQYKDTFHTHIDDGGGFIQDSDGSWFYNVPVNYYSVQTNYQNL